MYQSRAFNSVERGYIIMSYKTYKIDNHTLYENDNGVVIGTATNKIKEKDDFIFRDLSGVGELLPYEDWRLSPEVRAKDLAMRLSITEIAGLMMYSPHQMVPAFSDSPFGATYNGKVFGESEEHPWSLTDQQKSFLDKDHIRHVLAMYLQDPVTAAKWNNQLQEYCEKLPFGIPVNISSDPRHEAGKSSAEYKSEAGQVSKWPSGLGIGATFDPDLCKNFAEIVAKEYRAMGIATALSPQIDLGTEPRWMRVSDTFGADPRLVTDMAKAYCDGIQTTKSSETGWGSESVSAMVKHWPGGGPCEGGRDAHYPFGKYAVYPGDCFDCHTMPFIEGAFKLDGPTNKCASVMPYYSISYDIDPTGNNVGNSYSSYIINDLLREKFGFDGVVCTDWVLTNDIGPSVDALDSHCFGYESATVAERHLRILECGVDQFGGNSDIEPILEAFELGCKKYGYEAMDNRFRRSAVRILINSFRCGLFDNPYLDPIKTEQLVGCKEHCEKGFDAQLKSIVMLKNNGVLPIIQRKKVFIPNRHIDSHKDFFRFMAPAADMAGADKELTEKYFDWTENAEDADFAIVMIESPISDGYSKETGYRPVTLQYRPYTAETARNTSIAGGDPRECFKNRSYKGKTNTPANSSDLDIILNTKEIMKDKPVIVCIKMNNPCVVGEFEEAADAILVDFGVQQEALFTIISGKSEPYGLLPVQLPKDMEAVEKHCEDKPLDIEPYCDSNGNKYDFGFGMNWSGIINDERRRRYCKD